MKLSKFDPNDPMDKSGFFMDLETGEIVDTWDKWIAFCQILGIDPDAPIERKTLP